MIIIINKMKIIITIRKEVMEMLALRLDIPVVGGCMEWFGVSIPVLGSQGQGSEL